MHAVECTLLVYDLSLFRSYKSERFKYGYVNDFFGWQDKLCYNHICTFAFMVDQLNITFLLIPCLCLFYVSLSTNEAY